jgi:hypothetical protein
MGLAWNEGGSGMCLAWNEDGSDLGMAWNDELFEDGILMMALEGVGHNYRRGQEPHLEHGLEQLSVRGC